MDGRTQGALLLAVGGVTVRLAMTDAALNYIRPEYVPLQLIGGAVLLVLGAVTLARGLHSYAGLAGAQGPGGQDDALAAGHGHDHDSGPRVAWMLAAPLFAILLIAPPPLGSFAAGRQSGVIQATDSAYGPLPPAEDDAVPLGLGDFTGRALYDTGRSLEGQRVRLTGFVSREVTDGVGGWMLTRFAMSCCAADGTAINVEVVHDGPMPPIDQWVVVEGTWHHREGYEIGTPSSEPALLQLEELEIIDQPVQPYET